MLFLLLLSLFCPVFSTLALKKSFYNLELIWDFPFNSPHTSYWAKFKVFQELTG